MNMILHIQGSQCFGICLYFEKETSSYKTVETQTINVEFLVGLDKKFRDITIPVQLQQT